MRNKFAIALSILLMFGCPLMAADIQESVISTQATINRDVAPDTAIIRFYVENSGLNVTSIKEKNDKIVNDAIEAIKKLLSPNESVKTIAFNVRNIYSYRDKVRVFQKYEVQNGFEVKLKDMTKIAKVINTAMDNGVKNVSGVSFLVEDSETVCNEMMAEAAKIAKNRVKYISSAVGENLLKVKSIEPYCSLSGSNRRNASYKTMASNSTMDSVESDELNTIEAGTINARANVNVVYYLK